MEQGRGSVSLLALADRVIEMYWTQLRPYGTTVHTGIEEQLALRQNKQSLDPPLFAAIRQFQTLQGSRPRAWRPSLRWNDPRYARLQRGVAAALAQMPATHLQGSRGGGARPVDFLHRGDWLHRKVTRVELVQQNWTIEMLPGAAEALRVTSAITLPAIRALWEADVRRFNRGALQLDRLTEHLFGSDRIDLGPVRHLLRESQGNTCFYCDSRLGARFDIDHVLPWSRSGCDDLANLVAACEACNRQKSDLLPAPHHLLRAIRRDELEPIAETAEWPLSRVTVLRVGLNLMRTTPTAVALWDIGTAGPKSPRNSNQVVSALEKALHAMLPTAV